VNLRSLLPWRKKSGAGAPTPAARNDSLDPFLTFRREVDRVFDDLFEALPGQGFSPMTGWQGMAPVVDVAETDKEIVVTAELPGLDEKDLQVTLAGDVLIIKGEKKAEREQKNGGAHYIERHFGAFSRSLRLPFAAQDDKIEAKYDKGVLTIRVPKPPAAQRLLERNSTWI
jgi:HSP20 family protein